MVIGVYQRLVKIMTQPSTVCITLPTADMLTGQYYQMVWLKEKFKLIVSSPLKHYFHTPGVGLHLN